jgi:putative hydrolase of the HAD superfamily
VCSNAQLGVFVHLFGTDLNLDRLALRPKHHGTNCWGRMWALTPAQGPHAVLREDTVPFLDALKASGKQRILLTNAHPHNLAVKLEHTGLASHLDLLLSTHTFGYPKEDQRLWQAVAEKTGLQPERTLFIDDSEPILDAAAQFGIRYCLGVTNPDSGLAEKSYLRHPGLNDYRRMIPSLSVKEKP